MTNDPVGDFLAQLKNAIQRRKSSITIKSSKMLEAIASILKEEGFIEDFSVEEKDVQNELTVTLKYVNGDSAITTLSRVSKPGVRRYVGYRDIVPVRKGLGLAILSTPQGVISGKKARDAKVGGEYICEIF